MMYGWDFSASTPSQCLGSECDSGPPHLPSRSTIFGTAEAIHLASNEESTLSPTHAASSSTPSSHPDHTPTYPPNTRHMPPLPRLPRFPLAGCDVSPNGQFISYCMVLFPHVINSFEKQHNVLLARARLRVVVRRLMKTPPSEHSHVEAGVAAMPEMLWGAATDRYTHNTRGCPLISTSLTTPFDLLSSTMHLQSVFESDTMSLQSIQLKHLAIRHSERMAGWIVESVLRSFPPTASHPPVTSARIHTIQSHAGRMLRWLLGVQYSSICMQSPTSPLLTPAVRSRMAVRISGQGLSERQLEVRFSQLRSAPS